MTSQIVLNAFVGDALSLGPHWIYDQKEIREKFGPINRYFDPGTSYHPGKRAGDLTHYGDQTLVLLRSVAKLGRFDLASFAADWQAFWEDPATISYRDSATRTVMENLGRGLPRERAATPSTDTAGACRIAALFALPWESEASLLAAVRAQTSFTHTGPLAVEAAEFYARITRLVQAGMNIPDALREVSSLPHWKAIPRNTFTAAVASSQSTASDAAVATACGLACSLTDAFPLIAHLLLRYPHDAATSLSRNAEAGGDNAPRAMILGMIHGARLDAAPLPPDWVENLRAGEEIQQLTHTNT